MSEATFAGYTLKAEIVGEDYEWESMHLFTRNSDGKPFLYEDDGCSFNSPLEDPRPADLKPINQPLPLMNQIANTDESQWNKFRAEVWEAIKAYRALRKGKEWDG